MEKQFIPYEEALALKELGFDELVFGYYLCKNSAFGIELELTTAWLDLISYDSCSCKAPLWQQAFDFFNEKYGLDVNYDACIPTSYIPTIHFTSETGLEYRCHEMLKFFGRRIFDTKEDARIECLKKLIQVINLIKVVKNK